MSLKEVDSITNALQVCSISDTPASATGVISGHTVRAESKSDTDQSKSKALVTASVSQPAYKVKLSLIGEILADALTCLSFDIVKIAEGYVIGPKGDFGLTRKLQISRAFLSEKKPYSEEELSFLGFFSGEVHSSIKVYGIHLTSLKLLITDPWNKGFSSHVRDDGYTWSRIAQADVHPLDVAAVTYYTETTPNLTSLDIQCTNESVIHLPKFQKLEHLRFCYYQAAKKYDSKNFAWVLERMPQLKSLTVDQCCTEAVDNLHLLPNLENLTLCFIAEPKEGTEKLSQHKKLTELCLSGFDETCMEVIEYNPEKNLLTCLPSQLRTLTLDRCVQCWQFSRESFFSPPQSLETVVFKDCEISVADKTKIETNLKLKHPKLNVEFIQTPKKSEESDDA